MNNSNISKKLTTMVIAAMLAAIGISIPMFSPIKFVMEPASYTLASHVPVMLAMFISPAVAAFVALIISFGFISYGPVIMLRALTHIIFATIGAYYLKKNPNTLKSLKTMIPFVLGISVIHSVAEVLVSSIYFNNNSSYMFTVLGLVGLGTIIHSSVDFTIAILIWKPLQRVSIIPSSAKVNVK
jgi:niacin transporter